MCVCATGYTRWKLTGYKGKAYARTVRSYLKSYHQCVYSFWRQCAEAQPLIPPSWLQDVYLFHRPCYHGDLKPPPIDFQLHIRVHQHFQINLTFTYFNLDHYNYCYFHHLKVYFSFHYMFFSLLLFTFQAN